MGEDFFDILDRIGQMPLPPYITEKLEDDSLYQTVYARESVLTALGTGDGAPAFELCDYDIDWAAAHQREILKRWQALMEEDAP